MRAACTLIGTAFSERSAPGRKNRGRPTQAHLKRFQRGRQTLGKPQAQSRPQPGLEDRSGTVDLSTTSAAHSLSVEPLFAN